MLVAQPERDGRVEHVAAVGDDEDPGAGERLVHPDVQERAGLGGPAGLLGDLADDALRWGLGEFQASAGEFPFPAFISQEQDAAVVIDDDSLDRDRSSGGR
ncbi:hypothetical protein GCM10023085_10760 [Actinomadura viridis]